MPGAIAAAAAWWEALAATVIVEGVTIGMVLKSGAVIYGFVQANRSKQAARDSYNASLRDRTMMIRSPEAARRHIYGKTRASGVIIYGVNSGSKTEYLHLVVAVASHRLTAFDDFWLADKSIGTLDGSGYVGSSSIAWRSKIVSDSYDTTIPGSPYQITLPAGATGVQSVVTDQVASENNYAAVSYTLAGSVLTFTAGDTGKHIIVTYLRDAGEARLQVKTFLGAGARDTDLETASAGQWTSAHTLDEIARFRASFKPDPDTFPNGLANLSAIVRGKALYDPRTSTTVYSNNPALVVMDYLRATHGFRADLSEIDLPSFIAAANICDEAVPLGGGFYQTRYTCDGVISEDGDRIENLKGLLSSMVGEVAYIAGKWYLRAGAFYASEMTLTDSDFAGGQVTVTANTPRRNLFNAVKGRFVDPVSLWAYSDFPAYESATYATEDGGETIYADVDLPFTTDVFRAQRIAKLILFKSRQSLTMQATFKLKALPLSPMTTIRVKLAEFGWDTIDGGLGKLFVVRERVFNPDTRTVTLTLQEEASAVYAWDYSEATTPDASPNTDLKNPRDIDPISITVTSSASTYKQLKDGTIVPFVLVTWPAITDALVTDGGNVKIAWKRANETVYQSALVPGAATAFQIDGIGPGEILNIGAQAINAAQVSSDWDWETHTVSASLVTNSQSPRFGLGTNQLAGSSLKSGIPGWTAIAAGGYSASLAHIIGAIGAPKPFGAVALTVPSGSTGTDVAQVVADGLRIPVAPGQRVEAQARVQNFRGNARLQVEFHNAAGTLVGAAATGSNAATTSNTAALTEALADFTALWMFATVPAGAVTAQLAIYTSRTSTGGATAAYFAQPYLGLAHDNQSLPSPWTDGPPRGALSIADLATTSLISPNAATETGEVTGSTLSVTTTPVSPGTVLTSVCSVTVTNPTAQACVVTLFGRAEFEAASGGTLTFDRWGGIHITSSAEGTTVPTGEPICGATISTGSVQRSLEPSRRFTLGAGATETYTMYFVLEQDIVATLDKAKLRYELIKR